MLAIIFFILWIITLVCFIIVVHHLGTIFTNILSLLVIYRVDHEDETGDINEIIEYIETGKMPSR